jgi:hypothetical protein
MLQDGGEGAIRPIRLPGTPLCDDGCCFAFMIFWACRILSEFQVEFVTVLELLVNSGYLGLPLIIGE